MRGSNVRNCPACGRGDSSVQGERGDFQIRRCTICRTLFTGRLPDEAEAMAYDYYYSPENLNIPAFVQQRLKEIAAGFAAYRRSNRLLDVGFGEGSFLAATTRAGWDAEGVEVCRGAVEHARASGLKVFCGSLEEAKYPDEHFDVVRASELIEHLTDPRSFLTEIARILRAGGLLWATTPNGGGVSAKTAGMEWTVICPPEHLQLFSAQGVRELLTATGFRKVKIAAHGLNLFEILHHYRRARCKAQTADAIDAPRFDRVASGYKLNKSFTTNRMGRMVKYFANGALGFTGWGDSLKITAVK